MKNSHSLSMAYLFWIFGFMGGHRFYLGKTKSGILYFFTFGLLGVGWLIDLFLMPSLDRQADLRYPEGQYNYNICWLLLIFFGPLGLHRIYLGKWVSGILYFFTTGFFAIGWLYDLCTINEQILEKNQTTL